MSYYSTIQETSLKRERGTLLRSETYATFRLLSNVTKKIIFLLNFYYSLCSIILFLTVMATSFIQTRQNNSCMYFYVIHIIYIFELSSHVCFTPFHISFQTIKNQTRQNRTLIRLQKKLQRLAQFLFPHFSFLCLDHDHIQQNKS